MDKLKKLTKKEQEIRELAEADLVTFIKLVAPERVLGDCHIDVIRWWEREDASTHQLLLFPRDHMKSALIAYRVAWHLTKDPTLRVLYISSTSNLAEKQLGFIKNILTSKIYSRYWPYHVHPEEGKREKWTNSEISLDHPDRKKENIRDPSVFTAGLTTGITGMHCDIAVLDDIVVRENAYTKVGREQVQSQYSLLSSIEGADAREWVVGTRYHPKDLYNDMLEMTEIIYDELGEEPIDEQPIYEIMQRPVEEHGEFLWPRQQRSDGKWFGFNRRILERKRGTYLDQMQFRAQYYNDPSDPDNVPISNFLYFDRDRLKQEDGYWFYRGKKLNLVAAIDFAYTIRATSDYTAIIVIGTDEDGDHYVLDINRFRTDKISEYFNQLMRMHNRWGFRRLVAETTAAQSLIVDTLKRDHFQRHGIKIKVIEVKPTKSEGTKEERIEATLHPVYENSQVYHYRGGNTQILEEELTSRNPPHDDCKDALTNAIANAVRPTATRMKSRDSNIVSHPRWGGRAF